MVWMAMNRHLFGPEHSEPLDIFSEPSPSRKDYSPGNWGRISTEACIVATELYVRCQYQVKIPSSEDFGYIPRHAICTHIRSLDPENLMAPIIKCLLSHRNMASCEKCKGVSQCSSCTTEFEIQISRFGATGHILEITYWKNFGAGRSLNDPKWTQHQFSTSSGLHAAKFSSGSVRSAFEAQKYKKYAKLYSHYRKEQTASTLQKSIGRNLSCSKLMLQFTSYENDLFYMVFAGCKMYRAVAKCDWTRF